MKKIVYFYILVCLPIPLHGLSIAQRIKDLDDQIASLTNTFQLRKIDMAIDVNKKIIADVQTSLKNNRKIKNANRILQIALKFDNKKQIEKLKREIEQIVKENSKGLDTFKNRIEELQKEKAALLNNNPQLQDLLKEKNQLIQQLQAGR